MTTAAQLNMASCHDCGRVGPLTAGHARCTRCGSALHSRKKQSLARTWALLIASYVMYIPANVLPVSTVIYFGSGQPDTIMSGVKLLFQHGDAPVALVLFFASVMVPSLKLLLLTWLVASVQFGWTWRPRERTVVYRIVEVIGRWSMLDIFVISLLVALVQLQAISTIHAGPGAVAFCAVVVLTMLAAESFDPRLMWDPMETDP
jgi:paraquat-inducible protein A